MNKKSLESPYKIFLLAQPNSGKTTLFNTLTGKRCYVANWPGKTVEVFHGEITHHGKKILIVDLPGINSFKTLGKEEELTKEIIFGKEGVVVLLINGESLYRSLYFAIQVLEVRSNVLVVINKSDFLESRGIHINLKAFSEKLNVDVIQISALKGIGVNQLIDRALDLLEGRKRTEKLKIDYGILESYIEEIESLIHDRGLAVKLLEGDEYVLKMFEDKKEAIEKIKKEIEAKYSNAEEIIAMQRHKFVSDIIKSSVREVKVSRNEFEERLDSIFFSRFGFIPAILLLLGTIALAFTINTGFPFNLIFSALGLEGISEKLEKYSLAGLISLIIENSSDMLKSYIPDSWWGSLITDGIIAGLGVILTFFPIIVVVNFLMSILEDSGLMARIAVSLNKFFSMFGLTGKSVFPFGISLACNVPGVMASRILETDAERIKVALSSPFVICQARLLVIVLFAAAFLSSPLVQSLIVTSMYLLSTILFLSISKLYGKITREEVSELLLELPPYHFPSMKVSWWITWERSKSFITKISGFLLLFAVLIWALDYFALAEPIGSFIAKIFKPMGLDDWTLGFSLIVGFFAKELIIESLAIVHGTSDISKISEVLNLNLPQTVALLVFVAFYTPCAATLFAIFSEVRNKKLVTAAIILQILIAYVISFLFFVVIDAGTKII
ncbi:MAG: ferrous iron transport protein B [Archaeoglobaceae archaeon]